jgi:hypothetical protein
LQEQQSHEKKSKKKNLDFVTKSYLENLDLKTCDMPFIKKNTEAKRLIFHFKRAAGENV